jgi:hypothetical protein
MVAVFVPQTIFSVQGNPVLFGTIKSGVLKTGMTAVTDGTEIKVEKIETQGETTTLGVTLSGIDVAKAQQLVNQEIEFSAKKP